MDMEKKEVEVLLVKWLFCSGETLGIFGISEVKRAATSEGLTLVLLIMETQSVQDFQFGHTAICKSG